MSSVGLADHSGAGNPGAEAGHDAFGTSGHWDDPAACAVFAEAPRAALAALNGRIAERCRHNSLAGCQTLLTGMKQTLAALDIAGLEPPSGLSGLFDSRARRLRTVLSTYTAAATLADETAARISERAGAVREAESATEALWSQVRDAVTALETPVSAARGWLKARPVSLPITNDGTPESAEGPGQAAPAPSDAPLHPLIERLEALSAVQRAALAGLPILRAYQNAEHRLPAALTAVGESLQAWRTDSLDALGLSGRKPRKVRPDPRRLEEARAALARAISVAEAELESAIARRSELQTRTPVRSATEQN